MNKYFGLEIEAIEDLKMAIEKSPIGTKNSNCFLIGQYYNKLLEYQLAIDYFLL